MSASWAAVLVAAVAVTLTVASVLWRGGRHEGKLDAVLERLTDMAEDHEDRLLALERGRGKRSGPRPAASLRGTPSRGRRG